MRSIRYWCGGIETGRDSKATLRMNPPPLSAGAGADTWIRGCCGPPLGLSQGTASPAAAIGGPMMVSVKLLGLEMPMANPCHWPERIRTVVCCTL